MAAVYYKVDGDNCYFTNEAKSGYTQYDYNTYNTPSENKNAIIELYEDKFIIEGIYEKLFYGATNTTFNDTDKGELYNSSFKKMFMNCTNLTSIDLSHLDVSTCYSIVSMFERCNNLRDVNINGYKADFNSASSAFKDCSSLQKVDLSNGSMYSAQGTDKFFSGCSSLVEVNLHNWYTPNMMYIYDMFRGCTNLTTIHTKGNTDGSTYPIFENLKKSPIIPDGDIGGSGENYYEHAISNMFTDCTSLYHYSASSTSISKANNIDGYFSRPYIPVYYKVIDNDLYYCNMKKDDSYIEWTELTSFDPTTIVTRDKLIHIELYDNKFVLPVNSMALFYGATNTIYNDMDKGDTDQCNSLSCLFDMNLNLTKLNLSYFKTSNVQDMHSMFSNCRSIEEIDCRHFDTSNVTNFSYMFSDCGEAIRINIYKFNVDKVTDFRSMFSYSFNLRAILTEPYADWTYGMGKASSEYMFAGCNSLPLGDETITDGMGASTHKYFTAWSPNGLLNELYVKL